MCMKPEVASDCRHLLLLLLLLLCHLYSKPAQCHSTCCGPSKTACLTAPCDRHSTAELLQCCSLLLSAAALLPCCFERAVLIQLAPCLVLVSPGVQYLACCIAVPAREGNDTHSRRLRVLLGTWRQVAAGDAHSKHACPLLDVTSLQAAATQLLCSSCIMPSALSTRGSWGETNPLWKGHKT